MNENAEAESVQRVIAIIPARGGSKGIPGKNLKKVGGKSLIRRAVDSLQQSGSIHSVYVSSDSDEILAEAKRSGAKAVIRPDSLSGDQASSESALIHTLENTGEASRSTIVVFVQATSPFIEPEDIREAIQKITNGHADVVFSATSSHAFIWKSTPSGMEGINHDKSIRLRRQDMDPEYRETGAFYVMKTAGFLESGHRFFGHVEAQVTNPRLALDIDEEFDLELARMLARAENHAPDLSGIRALITDFDGVHTNNLAIVNQKGIESVMVNRSDGLGVSRLKKANIKFLILSKERNPVVSKRAEKLGVENLQGIDDKAMALREWAKENKIELSETAYIGNDINDLAVMEICGVSIAVADSYPGVLEKADWILEKSGGQGAIREVADRLLSRE